MHGELEAQSIGLNAPVVEGTGDAQLAVAVGHVPSSVWPSSAGTAVLSAHDVTWFSQIGQLKQGSTFQFVTPCETYRYVVTKTEIVKAGSPIYSTSASRIVLTSCYPFTALYLTPDRYLVEADLVSRSEKAAPATVLASYPTPSLTIPPALATRWV